MVDVYRIQLGRTKVCLGSLDGDALSTAVSC